VNANDAALNFYGWDKETLLSKRIKDVNTLPAETLAEEMKKAFNREKIKFDFKHRLADGSVRDVEAFSKRVELDGHDRILSIIHDVTDRKVA